MKAITHLILILLLLIIAEESIAQKGIYLEMLPGAAYTIPSKLSLQQDGFEDISFRAIYKTEPFKLPIYYSLRVSYYFRNDIAIETELNHHKIYLTNNPVEIQQFSISHGYNQLWFNVLKDYNQIGIRAGIGPVIAHPENTVRNLRLPQNGGLYSKGYFIHGVSSQLGLQYRFNFARYFFLTFETKANFSYSRTIIVNGHATLWINSFHALIGAGIKL